MYFNILEVVSKKRIELIDITNLIQNEVYKSNVKEGICILFVPHTTAGITINENADPNVSFDITSYINKLIPQNNDFRHLEGNSDSHIKSSIFGCSLNLIIHNSKLVLGTWQAIYFSEFDGPRTRNLYVKCIEG